VGGIQGQRSRDESRRSSQAGGLQGGWQLPPTAHLNNVLPLQHAIRVGLKAPRIHDIIDQETEVGLQELVAIVGLGLRGRAPRRSTPAVPAAPATRTAAPAATTPALLSLPPALKAKQVVGG
jgi:hypothetical protein